MHTLTVVGASVSEASSCSASYSGDASRGMTRDTMPDVLLLATIIFALLHVTCGLTSICVGAISCSQSNVLRAHNVSPIWSGICVSANESTLYTMYSLL